MPQESVEEPMTNLYGSFWQGLVVVLSCMSGLRGGPVLPGG